MLAHLQRLVVVLSLIRPFLACDYILQQDGTAVPWCLWKHLPVASRSCGAHRMACTFSSSFHIFIRLCLLGPLGVSSSRRPWQEPKSTHHKAKFSLCIQAFGEGTSGMIVHGARGRCTRHMYWKWSGRDIEGAAAARCGLLGIA